MSSTAVPEHEKLIYEYMPLARRLAARYRSPDGQEDVEQVAYMALVKAARRYDPSRGTTFLTYAIPTINGEIKKHFRDTSWSVHVPRGLQTLSLKARQVTEDLTARLGRPPTIGEIASRLGVDDETALEAIGAASARDTRSLDETAGDGDDDGATVGDRVAVEDFCEELIDRDLLRRALATLTPRARVAIGLRFFHGMSQSEIGARLGVSQMAISRLLRRALDDLRQAA